MNNTFKNSIVGGLAIFGLVSLISSSISPAPANEEHKYEIGVSNGTFGAYVLNKQTGEITFYNSGKEK